MPELPEVETVRRQLTKYVLNKKIAAVDVRKEKSWRGDVSSVVDQQIIDIQRSSKILRFVLSNQLSILAHLKMSGQLIYVDGDKRIGGRHPSPDWIRELPSSHTRVFFIQ